MNMDFKIQAPFEPAGDQPQAIAKLAEGVEQGLRTQVLLGATGTGKTYTIAQVINKVRKPTLVIAHNKTLAAQLASELKAAGFTDSFRYLHPEEVKYSWWSYRFKAREKNAGWRIDYFVVSDRIADKLQSAEIHNEVFGSDHCPVSVELDV